MKESRCKIQICEVSQLTGTFDEVIETIERLRREHPEAVGFESALMGYDGGYELYLYRLESDEEFQERLDKFRKTQEQMKNDKLKRARKDLLRAAKELNLGQSVKNLLNKDQEDEG